MFKSTNFLNMNKLFKLDLSNNNFYTCKLQEHILGSRLLLKIDILAAILDFHRPKTAIFFSSDVCWNELDRKFLVNKHPWGGIVNNQCQVEFSNLL